jgi:type VI secretion system protein ImpG
MDRKYYQQELNLLRESSKQFSRQYPSIAPMLIDGATDPDVERLLEGVAYLTANLNQQIDVQHSQLVKSLCQIYFPHLLQPTVSAAMMQFSPLPSSTQSKQLSVGTEFAAGNNKNLCKFSLENEVTILPLHMLSHKLIATDNGKTALRLELTTLGITLEKWRDDKIDFFINDDIDNAATLLYCIFNFCEKITVQAADSAECELPLTAIKSSFYSGEQTVSTLHPTQVLRHYLVFPQQFLKFSINNLQNWTQRGSGKNFTLVFYFEALPEWCNLTDDTQLLINTSVAFNKFNTDAKPILRDQLSWQYRLEIDENNSSDYAICAVNSVTGTSNHTTINYELINSHLYACSNQTNYYSLQLNNSGNNNHINWNISFYDETEQLPNSQETISVGLRVCNTNCADTVLPGSINKPTYTSPENTEFKNLAVPSKYYAINLDDRLLWRFISLINYNFLGEAKLEKLKEIIELYAKALLGYNREAIQNKLAHIDNYKVNSTILLYAGSTLPGYEVEFSCTLAAFISHGQIYLFGEVINIFLASQLTINTFLRLSISIKETGETIEWPARSIDRILN